MTVDNTGGQYGPSWWDVEQLHERIEAQYDCQVAYHATCTRTGASGRYGWWIRAGAFERKRLDGLARAWGGYAFRGNGGAKTYTAAMWMALSALEDALNERKTAAEQRSLF